MSISLLLPAVMSFRRRPTNVTPNHVSPEPTSDSVSAGRQSNVVTNQEPFHAFATQTDETESPVDEASPQEMPLLPPRSATPPLLPPGSGGLIRQSTRCNPDEIYSSTPEERDPSQPPNVVPVPPPLSDPSPPPVGSGAARCSPNPVRRISFLRAVCYLLPLACFGSVLYVITVYFSWEHRSDVAGELGYQVMTHALNGVGSGHDQPGQFILNDILQVAILGNVSRFDWLDAHRLSVTWSIVGLGEYQSQPMDEDSHWYPAVNRAVDVYLDEWVKIRLIYLGITERWNASVSKPAFSYDPARLPVTSFTGEKFG